MSNSGAEAVEAAVKLAKIATRRPIVIAFHGGFHGRTHAAMSLTSSSVKYRGHYEPLAGSVYFAPFPYALRNATGRSDEAALQFTLDAIDELFATLVYPEDVAAFLVEPVLGEGGYVVAPDAAPDIVIMAKGIASGMPLSGILAPRALLDRFGPGAHGGTFGGNAVACAAALATLDVIDDEGLVSNARRQGERLLAGLRRATVGDADVAEVRGRGLMVGIEFATPDTLAPLPDRAKQLLAGALDRRLLLLTCGTYGQVVRIIPPLNTTDDEVDLAIEIVGDALKVR
jgi:4-aminobutyrate aminotransferase